MRKQDYVLTNSYIDTASSEIEKALKKQKVPSAEIIKTRLKAEETMGFYQSRFGENAKFSVKFSSGADRRITLLFEGEKIKPFKEERDEFIDGLVKMLGEVDSWQYKHHTNIVELKIPRRPLSQIARIGIALLCAVLFAFVFPWLTSQHTAETVRDVLVSPVVSLLVGVLRSAACILIFTSIAVSIVNIGDIRAFKKVGKSLFSNFLAFMVLNTAVAAGCLAPWLNFSFGDGAGALDSFAELFKTVLNMIPANPISPFIDGNAVQVIFLAVFCGVILSLLGERVGAVKQFLQEFDTFISCVIEKFNYLLPFMVFLVMSDTLLNDSIASLVSYKRIVLMWMFVIALQLVLNVVFTTVFGKMNVVSYLKKAKSVLMVAFFTASSAAALPVNMEVCRKEFQIDERLVDLGIPIGQVLFMPCSAAGMIASCVSVSSLAGMKVSLPWILTAVIISVILAAAMPPAAGATLMAYSLLFAQMGLPKEYFGAVLAMSVITDSIVTMLNASSLHYLLLKVNNKESKNRE